jgi:hypothetical protein
MKNASEKTNPMSLTFGFGRGSERISVNCEKSFHSACLRMRNNEISFHYRHFLTLSSPSPSSSKFNSGSVRSEREGEGGIGKLFMASPMHISLESHEKCLRAFCESNFRVEAVRGKEIDFGTQLITGN